MPQNHAFTHGSYDVDRAGELFSDSGFAEAASAALGLLGTTFVESPRAEEFARAVAALRSMDVAADWPFGDPSEKGRAAALLARGAGEETGEDLVRAHTRLFKGPAALPAPPWGSVYMDRDKVLNGWTWVELRSWMRANGIAGAYAANDPEDNFGRLLALAAELAARGGAEGGRGGRSAALFCELLADHLLPWAPRFLELFVAGAQSATYEGLGVLCAATLGDLRRLLGIQPAPRRIYR